VLFGAGLKFWLHRLLFIDALSYLSRGRLSVSLKRYLLIDIDDIFVGEKGTRLRKNDVQVNFSDISRASPICLDRARA
jgi:heparan sulfate N-deacetylase/N-sulfotransferase NDST2